MGRIVKDTGTRVTEVRNAWGQMRPEKTFFGLTLYRFDLEVKPYMDAKAEIADLEVRMQHAVSKLDAAELTARKVVKRVVNAVKGDPEEGEDGPLYAAMGYIPESQRASGLKRARKEATPVSKEGDAAVVK